MQNELLVISNLTWLKVCSRILLSLIACACGLRILTATLSCRGSSCASTKIYVFLPSCWPAKKTWFRSTPDHSINNCIVSYFFDKCFRSESWRVSRKSTRSPFACRLLCHLRALTFRSRALRTEFLHIMNTQGHKPHNNHGRFPLLYCAFTRGTTNQTLLLFSNDKNHGYILDLL
jgi:hypothetical protein